MEVAKNGRRAGPDVPVILTPRCGKCWGGGGARWACQRSSVCQCRCVHCKESEGRLREAARQQILGGQGAPQVCGSGA